MSVRKELTLDHIRILEEETKVKVKVKEEGGRRKEKEQKEKEEQEKKRWIRRRYSRRSVYVINDVVVGGRVTVVPKNLRLPETVIRRNVVCGVGFRKNGVEEEEEVEEGGGRR